MAGNTKCYRVTVNAAGGLEATVVEFSPRYADTVTAALERLRTSHLTPPTVRFGDWPELVRRWAAEREGTA